MISARKPPGQVNLFAGAIYAPGAPLDAVRERLTGVFGAVDLESPPLPFTHTDYYAEEMGGNLTRVFFSFAELIPPERIADAKLITNGIELEFARERGGAPRRTVNLDPGCLDLSKVVLATTKNYAHRIYLRDGIYAEATLRFHKGTFRPWEWTYPDYRTEEYVSFFNEARKLFKRKLSG
ncbi:MAG: DUF4416 family protein [bacterium]